MSDYSRAYDFSVKDALASGDSNKKIKGSEVDAEFDALVVSSATKADKVVGGITNNLVKQDSSGNLTDAGYAPADIAAAATKVSGGDSGNLTTLDASGDLADSGYSPADLIALMARKNYVLNPDGYIDQQAVGTYTSATTPANNDDTYLMDQWVLLSDGNDILDVGATASSHPLGRRSGIVLDVETANKRAGIMQPIEAAETEELEGQSSVTCSAQVYIPSGNTTVDTVRLILAAWDGSADSITSDIVGTWNAEGAAPTLAANWTQVGTTTATPSADTWTEVSLNADLSSAGTINNMAVFVMLENDDGTVGDLVYVSDVRLVLGASNQCQTRGIAEELALCERFYEKTYDLLTAPGTATTNGAVIDISDTGGYASLMHTWRVRKRTVPSVTLYSPNTGASGNLYDPNFGDRAATPGAIGEGGTLVGGGPWSASYGMQGHMVGDARL